LLSKNRVEMAQWGLIIFLGVALIGAAFTITLIRPLNDLQEKARQVVKEYSLGTIREPSPGNEISTFVRAIHRMVKRCESHFERTKAEEQLRQSQKMEAIGKLAGGVAHDFNKSPFGHHRVQRTAAVPAREGGPRSSASSRRNPQGGERAASLTHQLLAFSRRQVLTPKPIRITRRW
jgi:HAMP domain-containing protein